MQSGKYCLHAPAKLRLVYQVVRQKNYNTSPLLESRAACFTPLHLMLCFALGAAKLGFSTLAIKIPFRDALYVLFLG